MKSKNLVSLFVALIFLVLSTTGLLIYFGQSSHAVDHIHAWFGILFFSAAVFHIVNNWPSLKAYTKDRKTGGIQREFFLPALVAIVFTAGIGTNLPVFDQLANAGKQLFRGDKPRKGGPPSQAEVDSIARATETAFTTAYSTSDTATLSKILAKHAPFHTESGTILTGPDALNTLSTLTKNTVQQAASIDDNLIMVYGTLSHATKPDNRMYTHLLKKQDNAWQIAAVQTARPISAVATNP